MKGFLIWWCPVFQLPLVLLSPALELLTLTLLRRPHERYVLLSQLGTKDYHKPEELLLDDNYKVPKTGGRIITNLVTSGLKSATCCRWLLSLNDVSMWDGAQHVVWTGVF
jgi:hypothetical protein